MVHEERRKSWSSLLMKHGWRDAALSLLCAQVEGFLRHEVQRCDPTHFFAMKLSWVLHDTYTFCEY